GGMATVFLGERRSSAPIAGLSHLTPQRVAVKFMQIATMNNLAKLGTTPMEFIKKEIVALQRLSALEPPSAFVVGFYGCGLSDVMTPQGPRRLPWLALEYVDGGAAGSSLT